MASLPPTCPACDYDLSRVVYGDALARCPECGREFRERVPPGDWPFRCRRCREDLTGAEIESGRVLCQACGTHNRYPPAPDEPDVKRNAMWIGIVLLILTAMTTVFVVFIALRPPAP